MAALAIPIVILGSIYILSEQEKKDSGKKNATQEKFQKQDFLSGGAKQTENFSNYRENVPERNNPNLVIIICNIIMVANYVDSLGI